MYAYNFQCPNANSDFLIFLEIKALLAETNYIKFLFYLIVIYEQKMKEIDLSTSATQCFIFPGLTS